MIDLSHLPLSHIATKHQVQLRPWVASRLNSVLIFYQKLYEVRNYQRFPTRSFKLLNAGIDKRRKSKLIRQLKEQFAHRVSIEEKLKIVRYLRIYLDKILKGVPTEIQKVTRTLDAFFIANMNLAANGKPTFNDHTKAFIETILYVFDYEGKFSKKSDHVNVWNAHRLAGELKVNVCPYCNRSYTNTVALPDPNNPNAIREMIRPEFDHFYPQSRYPYLSLSFYNLIPSCKTCNSTIKGFRMMDIDSHIHPYLGGFENDLVFVTGITVRNFLNGDLTNAQITLEETMVASNKTRALNSSTFFKLSDIYNHSHKDIAEEIFRKSTEASKEYLQKYWDFTSTQGTRLMSSPEDLYRNYIGNYLYKKDFYRRPLAKFQFDIATETGLVKLISSFNFNP